MILMDKNEIILEIKELCVEFKTAEGTVKAVNNLDYVLHKGEKLGIVGESGSGKDQGGRRGAVYADLIRKGLKTIEDVPEKLKKEVEEILERGNE